MKNIREINWHTWLYGKTCGTSEYHTFIGCCKNYVPMYYTMASADVFERLLQEQCLLNNILSSHKPVFGKICQPWFEKILSQTYLFLSFYFNSGLPGAFRPLSTISISSFFVLFMHRNIGIFIITLNPLFSFQFSFYEEMRLVYMKSI